MEKKSLLENKKFLIVISVLVSFILWLIISTGVDTVTDQIISKVPVTINTNSGIVSDLGLSVIEGGDATVDIVVSGNRSVIGGVTAGDIGVTASLSGVSGAGTYDLSLTTSKKSAKSFDIVSVSPSKITVKFDRFISKTIPVVCEVTGEYNIPDEFLQDSVYADPAEITITGPENDIGNIESAFVSVGLVGEFDVTQSVSGEIQLRDRNGDIVKYDANEIKMSDRDAKVIVPIHEVKELPLYFEYTSVPDYFDPQKLTYTMSRGTIKVEGEQSELEKYSDLFIGYINVGEIGLENSSFTFTAELPKGLGLMDNSDTVTVDFDLTDYAETTFYVRQLNLINVPSGFKATSNTFQTAVKMIGPKDVILNLSADDIVIQVDMSKRDINQTGQYRMTADVILPGGQDAWAEGTYALAVTVKKA